MPFNLCVDDPFLFFVQLFHRVKMFETIELGSSCNDSWGFLRKLVLVFVHLTRLQSLSSHLHSLPSTKFPFSKSPCPLTRFLDDLLRPKSSGRRSRAMSLDTTFGFLALGELQ
ncbi:hypothetical protein Bca4012_088085 [Brassica carinata]|uniref:Uncharacterized protein n=1 Tax=Brassica carinata TaxID=52824 RepID=A0A8X7TQN2_BRACI|nr:hypothetical protein Bca52824_088244 [Brassica carinata]